MKLLIVAGPDAMPRPGVVPQPEPGPATVGPAPSPALDAGLLAELPLLRERRALAGFAKDLEWLRQQRAGRAGRGR